LGLDERVGLQAAETAAADLGAGVQLMQVSPQCVDDRSLLADKGFTEVDQQPDLPFWAVQAGTGNPGSRSAARATANASIGSDLP